MPKKAPAEAGKRFLRSLGNTIREIRKEQGLHQEQLGARAGIAGSRIGEIERGEVDPGVSRIHAIACALDVSMIELFRRQDRVTMGSRAAEEERARLIKTVQKLGPREVSVVEQVARALSLRRDGR